MPPTDFIYLKLHQLIIISGRDKNYDGANYTNGCFKVHGGLDIITKENSHPSSIIFSFIGYRTGIFFIIYLTNRPFLIHPLSTMRYIIF